MNSDIVDFASVAPAYPELLMAVGALVLVILGVVINKERSGLISWLAVLLIAAAGVVILLNPADGVLFNGLFIVDAFARYMKLLVLGGAALSLILAMPNSVANGVHKFEYSILAVLATLGMMIMVSANDLMSLYIGLALQSLALYVMAALKPDEKRGPTPVLVDVDGVRFYRWTAFGIQRLLKSMREHRQYTPLDSLELCQGYAPFKRMEQEGEPA